MKKIAEVMFFPNGNTAVFDQDGEQIPELQNPWFRVAIEAIAEASHTVAGKQGGDGQIDWGKVEILLPDGRKAKIFETDESWNWSIE